MSDNRLRAHASGMAAIVAPVVALVVATVLSGLLGACGTSNQSAAPSSSAAPPPAPPPPAPPPTSPLYPSMGNRLGDPNRIGPDDLHLAVAAAQSSVSGSRLLSVEPASAAGHPVWNVRLLTEGPSLKQVQVDAVVRGAQAVDLPGPQADLRQTIVEANALKTSWDDVVAGLQRQHPGVVSSVVLDTSTPSPLWKITMLTGNRQIVYTVDGVTGATAGNAASPRPRQDYR